MSFLNTSKDGTGTAYWLLGDANGALYVRQIGYPELQSDETTNDSDKTITVPAGEEWTIEWIWVELTTTAVAGNRQLEIRILDDAADVIGGVTASIVQAASNTYYYLFAPNVTELTALRDSNKLTTIMPKWVLPAGYAVQILDNNAVDAAADDMITQVQVWVREIS
jgi:hypothetical protein